MRWNVWSSFTVCFTFHDSKFCLCKYHQTGLQSEEISASLHTDINIFGYRELSKVSWLCPYLLLILSWSLFLSHLFRWQTGLYKLVFQNFAELLLKQFLNTSQYQTMTFKPTNTPVSFSLKTSIPTAQLINLNIWSTQRIVFKTQCQRFHFCSSK